MNTLSVDSFDTDPTAFVARLVAAASCPEAGQHLAQTASRLSAAQLRQLECSLEVSNTIGADCTISLPRDASEVHYR